MRNIPSTIRNPHQREICKLFESLCGTHSRWQIWQDFVMMSAIAISNKVDAAHSEKREEDYITISSKYSTDELNIFATMFASVVKGMDANPNQDFLGELYMVLELGNAHAGQFFTPYDVCAMMSKLNDNNIPELLDKRDWIAVSDPACGAGATLVAFANECLRQKVNYQTHCLFVAQDIDYIVGCMCYLQLSLLGCPGYVVIGDSLVHPTTSYDETALLPVDNGNIWYTPMYFRPVWQLRKALAVLHNVKF